MRWATRTQPHVDRTACAWLIRRFVDPEAEFVFVSDPEEVPADATPFDMRGVELGHHDGGCSFEAFLAKYTLDDPALRRIAEIVHDADLEDERYGAPEAPGLNVALRGLSLVSDDYAVIETAAAVFDGLYALLVADRRVEPLS